MKFHVGSTIPAFFTATAAPVAVVQSSPGAVSCGILDTMLKDGATAYHITTSLETGACTTTLGAPYYYHLLPNCKCDFYKAYPETCNMPYIHVDGPTEGKLPNFVASFKCRIR